MELVQKNKDIIILLELRKTAQDLCNKYTHLDFASERNWLDDNELLEIPTVKEQYDMARERLKEHLLKLKTNAPDLLTRYYDFEIARAKNELRKDPKDFFAKEWLKRWKKVANGETDDIIFEFLLRDQNFSKGAVPPRTGQALFL